MTLSNKKRLAKAARSTAPKYEDRAEFQNRKGPGGIDLDPSEAIAWFPKLADAKHPFEGEIPAGCDVLVGYATFTFWLCDVEIGVEPGVYFGNIAQHLPDNDASLDVEQNIGFERRHVIRVRAVVAGWASASSQLKPPSLRRVQ